MRQFSITILLICLMIFAAVGVQAQQEEATATPSSGPQLPDISQPEIPGVLSNINTIVNDINETADRAELAAIAAEASVVDANAAVDRGFDLIGLFEGVGVVLGVIGGMVTIAGGVYIRNIQHAIQELGETREQVLQQLEQAREQLREELNQTTTQIEQEILEKQRELDELRQEQVESVKEQRSVTTKALMAQSLLTLGERQYQATDFQGAIETYSRAIELDSVNPITHYRLGYVYVHNNMVEKSIEHLTRALELDPHLAQALATLGYAYRRKAERMDEGIERNKLYNEAEASLLQALELSPRMIDDDGESWWGSLGGLYRRMGRVDQAIYAYQQAAEVTPRSSYPFSNLALLFMSKNDREQMLRTYVKVEELALGETRSDDGNYWAFNDLLTSRLALKKMDQAEQALASVLYTTPGDSTYALESLVDTLKRLMEALGPEDSEHIPPFIARIRQHIMESQSLGD